MTPRRAIVLVAVLAGGLAQPVIASAASGVVPTPPQPQPEKRNMTTPSASRPSAPVVAPVEHQGVRYAQDGHDDRAGDQPGGYLVALDAKTGHRLWRLKVYDVPDARAHGRPALPRYFRALRLGVDPSSLEIENDAGGVYRLDLAAHTSTQISGPPASAPARPPAAPKPPPE